MPLDLPTRADLQAIGRQYVLQRAQRIDPSQVDVEGSDANIFIGSTSVVGSVILRQLSYSVGRLFLDSCQGDDLDRYVWDRYQQTRKGASPAVGQVRIYRTSFTAGAGAVPSGTVLFTLAGQQYTTTTTANFGPTDLSSTAYVQAAQAGKATQASANNIRRFQSSSLLFDPSLQVNNDESTAGGEDVEQDDAFKNRIKGFWLSARRGTLAAIEFGALTVPGVVSAMAVEAVDTVDLGSFGLVVLPARIVVLYIADSSGVSNRALAALVSQALEDYRAGGIAVIVVTSLPELVAITIDLTFEANVDTVALTETIRAAIVEFINSLPVNGPLYVRELNAVLTRYRDQGLVMNAGTIVAPVGDLVPSSGQTIRATLATVTSVTS